MNWAKLDVPERFQGLYKQAMRGKSRKAAIRCHCVMCCGWDASEVMRCTATGCPLYPYRRSVAFGALKGDVDGAGATIAPDLDPVDVEP